jgi:hypothetical protein
MSNDLIKEDESELEFDPKKIKEPVLLDEEIDNVILDDVSETDIEDVDAEDEEEYTFDGDDDTDENY